VVCAGHSGARSEPGISPRTQPVIPAKAGIQYAAAHRLYRCRLWNTDRPVKPGDDSRKYSRGVQPSTGSARQRRSGFHWSGVQTP